MKPNKIKLVSALAAASSVVVMAVLAVELNEQTGTGGVSTQAVGGMSTGATVAATTTPPTALPIAVASPTMKADVPKGFR